MNKSPRVIFIHGRPKGHPAHAAYAKSLHADFYFEDQLLPWYEYPQYGKLRRYLSWIINAIIFPRNKYDVILTECIRIPQLLMKEMGLLRKKKLFALMDDESLFFLDSGKFSRPTSWLMKRFLNSVDGLICVGEFQTGIARKLAPNQHIKTVFNGIHHKSFEALKNLDYNSKTNNIVFIGNVDVDWRIRYKGLDLAITAVIELKNKIPDLSFTIIGSIDENFIQQFTHHIKEGTLKFIGKQENPAEHLLDKTLYLHPSRGEAWGISISEAMLAGIPAIVSHDTGMKELVSKSDNNLIVDSNLEEVKAKILWFLNLPEKKKIEISKKSRLAVASYTQEKAIEKFKQEFNSLIN